LAPEGGPEKNNWVPISIIYLWVGSWEVYLGCRRMVPNGSAWFTYLGSSVVPSRSWCKIIISQELA
jgi:hypothetical protein